MQNSNRHAFMLLVEKNQLGNSQFAWSERLVALCTKHISVRRRRGSAVMQSPLTSNLILTHRTAGAHAMWSLVCVWCNCIKAWLFLHEIKSLPGCTERHFMRDTGNMSHMTQHQAVLLGAFCYYEYFSYYSKNSFYDNVFFLFFPYLSYFLSAQGGQSYLEDAHSEGPGWLGRPDYRWPWLQTFTTRHRCGSCGERWSRTEVTPSFQALSGNHMLSWQLQWHSSSVLHPYATRHGFLSALPSNFKATVGSVFKLIWNLYRCFTIIVSDPVPVVGESLKKRYDACRIITILIF